MSNCILIMCICLELNDKVMVKKKKKVYTWPAEMFCDRELFVFRFCSVFVEKTEENSPRSSLPI